jgi:hypothetical protein
MKKLTRLESKLIAKYGLPGNAKDINPDDCSCGKKSCSKHDSWGTWLVNQIFEDSDFPLLLTSLDNLYPEPKYDEHLLDALATSKDYDKWTREEKTKIAKIEDVERRNAAYYNAWMMGRRGNEYDEFAYLQKYEIHRIAHVSNDRLVCSCSLISTLPEKYDGDEEALWAHPGHISMTSKAQVNLFVVEIPIKRNRSEYHHWCRNCRDLGKAKLTASSNVSLAELRKLRASHTCT